MTTNGVVRFHGGFEVVTMGREKLNQVHLYILNNIEEVVLYIAAQKEFLKVNQPKITKKRCCKSIIRLS